MSFASPFPTSSSSISAPLPTIYNSLCTIYPPPSPPYYTSRFFILSPCCSLALDTYESLTIKLDRHYTYSYHTLIHSSFVTVSSLHFTHIRIWLLFLSHFLYQSILNDEVPLQSLPNITLRILFMYLQLQ